MIQFPPIPSWDGLHPLVIHFPIALLLVAPLFILIGAVLKPQKGFPFHIAALLLMVLGTASIFVAVESGEAAGKLAERSAEITAVMERHSDLAEWTRVCFTALTFIVAGWLLLTRWLRRTESRFMTTMVPLAILVLYSLAVLLLVNTAHQGGLLVHQFGVRSI